MSLNSWRRGLFLTQRTIGDVNAVKRNRIEQRVWNRILGRVMSNVMKGLIK